MRHRITAPAVLAVVVCAGSGGCSAENRGSAFGPRGQGNGSSGGPNTASGGGSVTTSAATGAGGATGSGIITVDASIGTGGGGEGGGPGSADAACAVGSAEATFSPVNMFVTFDKSGSMSQNNKWTDATTAFIAFFRDPGTAGLRVAFRFFPDA